MAASVSKVLAFPRPPGGAVDLAAEGFHRVERADAFRRMVADRYQTRPGVDGQFWMLRVCGGLWGWSPRGIVRGRWTWSDGLWCRADLRVGPHAVPDDRQAVLVDDDVARVAFVERAGAGACRVYDLSDP